MERPQSGLLTFLNNMNKIYILAYRFLNNDGSVAIGGLETYIAFLCDVFDKKGFKVEILQPQRSSCFYEAKQYKRATVHFVPMKPKSSIKRIGNLLYKHLIRNNIISFIDDVLIFSNEVMISKNKFKKSVAIQHGISWDICFDKPNNFKLLFSELKAVARTIVKYRVLKNIRHLVCVDSNFISWLRAQTNHIPCDYSVIYNFSDFSESLSRQTHNDIRILFARRFEKYRGAYVFANIIDQLANFKNVTFTFAGEGSLTKDLRTKFENASNVYFTSYKFNESIEFHSNYDIAVIPTIGSEGTSLSAIEAMAAGCCVVSSNIGGMNDLIINGYNGILINPNDEKGLVNVLSNLIKDKILVETLANNARATGKIAFSKDRFIDAWMQVINGL